MMHPRLQSCPVVPVQSHYLMIAGCRTATLLVRTVHAAPYDLNTDSHCL
jgi:hypothetical protein